MANSASLTSGVAGRYATALFEIAKETDALDKVEGDAVTLLQAIADSADFRELLASPMLTRDEQAGGVAALADAMELGPTMRNTLGLMARNRRLFVLDDMLGQLRGLIANARGEITAEVVSARPLSDAQRAALAETLRASVGREVKIDADVDESLIGGLVVKVGSRMIDTSIRAKLAKLQNVMKEVG